MAFKLDRRRRLSLELLTDWSRGIVRDTPLGWIPDNALYDSVDFMLNKPGLMYKRGGTSYAGPALSGATYATTVVYADFPSGSQLLSLGDDGHLYKVTSGTTTDIGLVGLGYVPALQAPVLRVGGSSLLVIPSVDGTSAPKSYDGTTIATLGGSPPAGKYACVYKTRLVLGGNSANPNRIFFSPTPSITSTWDTTNSWIDADYAITGLASLSNAILIFSSGHTERIIGSTPPPGSDMDRAPIGSIGCSDARSIQVWNNNAIFANQMGVYLTNGAGFLSLTREGGIETYWQSQLSGYNSSTWSIAGGLIRGTYYIVSVMNGSTLVDTLVCNIPSRAWWRLSNIKARGFASSTGVAEELYYADRSTNRVVQMSSIFSPAAGNKNDANGSAVTPQAQFRLVGQGPFNKHFRDGRIGYDMRDAATDNPTLTVQVAPGLEATTFSTVPESPLAETTDQTRKRFALGKFDQAVSIKVQQTNASSKTEIYSLEVDVDQMASLRFGP